MTGDDGNAGPLLPMPDPETAEAARRAAGADRFARSAPVRSAGRRWSGQGRRALTDGALAPVRPISPLPVGLRSSSTPSAASRARRRPQPRGPVPREGQRPSPRRARRGRAGTGSLGPAAARSASRGTTSSWTSRRSGLYERHEPFSVALWVKPESDERVPGPAGQRRPQERLVAGLGDLPRRRAAPFGAPAPRAAPQLRPRACRAAAHPRRVEPPDSHLGRLQPGRRPAALRRRPRAPAQPWSTTTSTRASAPSMTLTRSTDRALRGARSYREFSGSKGIFTGALDDVRRLRSSLLSAASGAGPGRTRRLGAGPGRGVATRVWSGAEAAARPRPPGRHRRHLAAPGCRAAAAARSASRRWSRTCPRSW